MWLDPKTLRWLAEEADSEATEASRVVEVCARSSAKHRAAAETDPRELPVAANFEEWSRRWERSAALAARRAKRLRTIATKIERAASARRA